MAKKKQSTVTVKGVAAVYRPDDERVTMQVLYGKDVLGIDLPWAVPETKWDSEVNRVKEQEFLLPVSTESLTPFNNVTVFGADLNNLIGALLEDLGQLPAEYPTELEMTEAVVKRITEDQILFENKLLTAYRDIRFKPQPTVEEEPQHEYNSFEEYVSDKLTQLTKRIEALEQK